MVGVCREASNLLTKHALVIPLIGRLDLACENGALLLKLLAVCEAATRFGGLSEAGQAVRVSGRKDKIRTDLYVCLSHNSRCGECEWRVPSQPEQSSELCGVWPREGWSHDLHTTVGGLPRSKCISRASARRAPIAHVDGYAASPQTHASQAHVSMRKEVESLRRAQRAEYSRILTPVSRAVAFPKRSSPALSMTVQNHAQSRARS